MSDCVVRMEKPERCVACGVRMACPVYRAFLQVCATGAEPPTVGQNGCIIVCQLPEGHGRLIDASYVIDVMQDELDNDVHITVDDCFQIECKIPTIVPADTAERSET